MHCMRGPALSHAFNFAVEGCVESAVERMHVAMSLHRVFSAVHDTYTTTLACCTMHKDSLRRCLLCMHVAVLRCCMYTRTQPFWRPSSRNWCMQSSGLLVCACGAEWFAMATVVQAKLLHLIGDAAVSTCFS